MQHIRFRPSDFILGALLSVATVVALVGCGATTTSATTTSASPTMAPSPTPDVAGARAAALSIFYALPNQTPEIWSTCSQRSSNFADCPFSPTVVARLNYLSSIGFGADFGGCGVDYITGTQNGLSTAPEALSAVANADGSVSVVIRRGASVPNFTATMTLENGRWLASDLASGTGPSASMFSTKPNC
jgi:hypothetical protein